MTIAPKRDGAGVHARTRTPSVQLHRLVERLTHAIAAATASPVPSRLPLVAYDGSRLIVNPSSALKRLITDDEFLEAYTPGENSGFVCDIDLPPIGTTAKVGGRLLPGSEAATSAAIDHLQEVIVAALDRAIDDKDLGALCFDSTRAGLERIAEYRPGEGCAASADCKAGAGRVRSRATAG